MPRDQLVPGNSKINLDKLGWKPLEERRAAIKLKLFFKARLGLVDIPMHELHTNTRATRRQGTYAIPTSSVDSHLFSFYPSTIRLWNSLPASTRESTGVNAFTRNIDKIIFRTTLHE